MTGGATRRGLRVGRGITGGATRRDRRTAAALWTAAALLATLPAGAAAGSDGLTLAASDSRVRYGRSFTLSGALSSQDPACVSAREVVIERDVPGDDRGPGRYAATFTAGDGTYTVAVTHADRSATYTASATAVGSCPGVVSAPVGVEVALDTVLRLGDRRLRGPGRVALRVTLRPCGGLDDPEGRHRGTPVTLLAGRADDLRRVARARTDGRCRVRLVRRLRRTTTFQARSARPDADHAGSRSARKTVRVARGG